MGIQQNINQILGTAVVGTGLTKHAGEQAKANEIKAVETAQEAIRANNEFSKAAVDHVAKIPTNEMVEALAESGGNSEKAVMSVLKKNFENAKEDLASAKADYENRGSLGKKAKKSVFNNMQMAQKAFDSAYDEINTMQKLKFNKEAALARSRVFGKSPKAILEKYTGGKE